MVDKKKWWKLQEMKNKDTENKGGKKIDEVKNKDLMMLVNELKMLDFKNDRSFMSFSTREENELTKNEIIQKNLFVIFLTKKK